MPYILLISKQGRWRKAKAEISLIDLSRNQGPLLAFRERCTFLLPIASVRLLVTIMPLMTSSEESRTMLLEFWNYFLDQSCQKVKGLGSACRYAPRRVPYEPIIVSPVVTYNFLPFRFMRFDGCFLLTNDWGSSKIITSDILERFIHKQLDATGTDYFDLRADYFMADTHSSDRRRIPWRPNIEPRSPSSMDSQ